MNPLAVIVLLGCVSWAGAAEAQSPDLAINAKVRAALRANLGAEARHILVDSYGGTVQLSGSVDSRSTGDHALRAATDVDGVNHVQNAMIYRSVAAPLLVD